MLKAYNESFARDLALPKLSLSELYEVVESLQIADIVAVIDTAKN